MHYSRRYRNAPMPFSVQVKGHIFIHGFKEVPARPASHGCVRLPLAFSTLLFTVTQIGTVVIIANAASDPVDVDHPGLVLSADADNDIAAQADKLKGQNQPSPDDPNAVTVSVLVSSPDKTIEVLKNGDTIAKGVATIASPDQPLGDHVFILQKTADGKMKWCAISHGETTQVDTTVIDRIRATNPGRELDAGDIISAQRIPIGKTETAGELHDRLADLGPAALAEALEILTANPKAGTPQNDAEVTYAAKLLREDGRLDFTQPAADLERLIRAYHPWPGTFTEVSVKGKTKRLKIFPPVEIAHHPLATGALAVHEGQLLIGCGDGALALSQVQPEGSKAMPATAFANSL
jgi:hypothetical protein